LRIDFKDRNYVQKQPYLIGIDCVKFIISRDFTFNKDILHLYIMLQTILASLIVLVAFIVVLLPLFSKKKSNSSCDTCASGGCGGCPLSDAAKKVK